MQGTNDTRTTSVLVTTAVRLSLTLGLHRNAYFSGLDSATAERSRRAFWISFILDKAMPASTGLPSVYDDGVASLDFGELAGICSSGDHLRSVLFRSRVELAVVAHLVERELHLGPSSSQNLPRLLELDRRLEEWKEKLPSGLQPGNTAWPDTPPTARESILILHFLYYQTLISIHGFAAKAGQENARSGQSELSRSSQAFAAGHIIHLLDYLPPPTTWELLVIMLFLVMWIWVLISIQVYSVLPSVRLHHAPRGGIRGPERCTSSFSCALYQSSRQILASNRR